MPEATPEKRPLPAIVKDGWRYFRSEEQLKSLVLEYFAFEETRQRVPQMLGISVFIGCSHDTLRNYGKGMYDTETERYSEVLKVAADRIQYEKAAGAYDGRYNANFAKFDLTVNHDWIDKKAVEVTNVDGLTKEELTVKPIDAALSPEQSLRSYQDFCRRVADMATKEQVKK